MVNVNRKRHRIEIRADSLSDLIDYAEQPVPGLNDSDRASRRTWARRTERIARFLECKTWTDATRRAFHDPERVAGMRRVAARATEGMQTVRTLERNVNRGRLNVDAYRAGDPMSMIRVKRNDESLDSGSGKAVTLLINGAVSGGIDTEKLAQRGGALLALVAALESAGKSVEVIVGSYSEQVNSRTDVDVRCTLKRHGQAMSLDAMAFAIGSGDFFRRVIFGAREVAMETGFTSGRPTDMSDIPDGALYFGKALLSADGDRFSTDAGIREWVTEQAARCGVAVEF